MCFNQACSVGLGYFGRASPNITTYMYIFSVGLSSFPRNMFSSVFLGAQMWRTKQASSVLKINQRNRVSLHSGFCSTPPDASSGLKIYSLGSRIAAVSQPSAVRPLQKLPGRRELPHVQLHPFPAIESYPVPHQEGDMFKKINIVI